MSIGNGPSSTTSDKPGRSSGIEHNDLLYFGLARFDTRHLRVDKANHENSNLQYKKSYDPDRILEGMPVLECIFCDKYTTAIGFDMELHLYLWELLRQFPLKGKGYSMDFRIEYFIHQIKIRREKLEQIKNFQGTARAADMKELIKPSTTTTAAIDNHQPLDS